MEYLKIATRNLHKIKALLNCVSQNAFFRDYHSLKIKSSNGNVPWKVYKSSIRKLITTTLNWCDDENYFSREKAE